MDSLSQIVLGAAVGEAVLGKKIGARAALWGAIAGTIPDLDILFNFTHDFVEAQDLHRGFTHSITFSLLFAPFLAWLMSRIHRKRDVDYKKWLLMAFLALVTHPMLDNFTTWGTQFFWPFSDYRVAFNSVFVIDPLYTFPFLFFLVWALFQKWDSRRRKRLNYIGIIWSVTYLAVGLVNQQIMTSRFEDSLATQQKEVTALMVKPAPMSTFLWSATAQSDSGYYFGYASFFDSTDHVDWTYYPANHYLLEPYQESEELQTILKFTKGFYVVNQVDSVLIFNDLRFGMLSFYPSEESKFVFSYVISKDKKTGNVTVEQGPRDFGSIGDAFDQLWDRMMGEMEE